MERNKNSYSILISVFLLLFSISLGGLAQPANNTCETATDISSSIGSNICGDDGTATNDGDDGNVTSCYDSDSEVWYSFTGVSGINIEITNWCGTSYEPNITLYEGSCGGGLTELACDDYIGTGSQISSFNLNSANTYYLSVDNDQTDCSGSFCFDISENNAADIM